MSAKPLGRLEKVELRKAWSSEASDFTPWLAQEDNLQLLGESIGVELQLEAQEKDVGPFRADILCRDMEDKWVLIENQLERTDHTHLGQLLTYAAGLEAVTIVWVAKKFTEEHRAALDWLNEHTDESINLFGLEIELWKIGDSPIAPKFNVICKPNDWSRNVKGAANNGVSSQFNLKFWGAFCDYMESTHSFVRCREPGPKSWTDYSIGSSDIHLSSVISTRNAKPSAIRVLLYLKGDNAKVAFQKLLEQQAEIEQKLDFGVTWLNKEGNKHCQIVAQLEADIADESLWSEHFQWMKEKLEAMYKVFKPMVKDLKQAAEDNGE